MSLVTIVLVSSTLGGDLCPDESSEQSGNQCNPSDRGLQIVAGNWDWDSDRECQ